MKTMLKRMIALVLSLSMLLGIFTISASAFTQGTREAIPQAPSSALSFENGTFYKNKIATDLYSIAGNDKLYTDVTSVVGGLNATEDIDVVFILGGGMAGNELVTSSAINVFKPLLESTDARTPTVKIGMIALEKSEQVVLDVNSPDAVLTSENYESLITEKLDYINNLSGGATNLHSQLVEAYDMLSRDTSVKPENKYVFVLATGRTYFFDDANGNEATILTQLGDRYAYGNYVYQAQRAAHSTSYYMIPAAFNNDYAAYFAAITEWVENDGDTYVYTLPEAYGSWASKNSTTFYVNANATSGERLGTGVNNPVPTTPGVPFVRKSDKTQTTVGGPNHAMNYERAQYEAYHAYQALVKEGYNCFALCSEFYAYQNNSSYIKGNASQLQVGHAFMDYLAGGTAVTLYENDGSKAGSIKEDFFAPIAGQIVYGLAEGSSVEDYIGFDADIAEGYDFDLVLPENGGKLTLTVGDAVYTTTKIETKEGATASYAFTKHSTTCGDACDCEATFWLDYYYGNGTTTEKYILTFGETINGSTNVKLDYTLELVDRAYGVGIHDADVSRFAVLYPVNSDEVAGTPELFPIPAVNYTVEGIDISVSKIWNDDDNHDGLRPESITVVLFADGFDTGATLVLSAANGWTASFENLAPFVAEGENKGTAIVYSVSELNVAGYTTEITGDAANGFVITNTHEIVTTSISVSKIWSDDNNHDGLRPASITVKLLADGVDTGMTLVLSAENSWMGTFSDLNVYSAGQVVTYTVEEVSVDGYTADITGTAADGFVITNSHDNIKTSVSVSKVWNDQDDLDGMRPASITVTLFANGVDTGMTLVLNAANAWAASFENIDMYADGEVIDYTVKENEVKGYTGVITGSAANGFVITNTHEILPSDITVTKVWNDRNDHDGMRPDSITVTLLANGKDTGKTLTLNDANGWSATFMDLTMYENGEKINYTVKENEVPGYTSEITGSAANGFVITNTHEIVKTSVSVSKVWNDGNNYDGLRPASITVTLFADGFNSGKTLVLSDANGWSASFTDLNKFQNGEEIQYTVRENAVENYFTEISGSMADGFVITNTHEVIKSYISVSKIWNDQDDRDGLRPESITVTLLANGVDTGITVTLDRFNGWSANFPALDMYEDGELIVYSVEENEVEGYTAVITGDAANGFVITNTHEVIELPPVSSATVQLEGTKFLVEEGEVIGSGEGFSFVLVDANGNVVSTAISGADGKFVFTALVFDSEGTYTYTVKEVVEDNEDILYDTSVYTVTILVTKNGDQLEASVSLSKDNAATAAIEYYNEVLTEIPDEDIPQTGDNLNRIWFLMMIIAGVLMVTKFVLGKKKNDRKDCQE